MASSTKQHIVTALDEGIDAGFDAWYNALVENTGNGTKGLPQLRNLLAEVNRVGKKRGRKGLDRTKQVAFYCNKYADDLEGASTTTPTEPTPTTTTPTTEEIIAQAVAAALASIAGTTPVTPEVEVEDDEDEDERPSYTGKDPDAPATSGQLWRLNTLGHFGDVITKAEAFELIADAIDEA